MKMNSQRERSTEERTDCCTEIGNYSRGKTECTAVGIVRKTAAGAAEP